LKLLRYFPNSWLYPPLYPRIAKSGVECAT